MIKVLIIDDEPLACELIQEYLRPFENLEVIGFCHDGFSGLKTIQDQKPDLLFLDVQMPKINGFEMLELIEEPPALIFSTAFDQYALEAFETNAIDYLLKPYSKERFEKAIGKFLNSTIANSNIPKMLEEIGSKQKDQNRIVIKDGGKIKILPLLEIVHLEADDDYVKIYSTNGKFIKKKTLQFYEDNLAQDSFCRVHRSHLINISHIERIDPYEKNGHLALLKDGSKIPISRGGFQKLKEKLNI